VKGESPTRILTSGVNGDGNSIAAATGASHTFNHFEDMTWQIKEHDWKPKMTFGVRCKCVDQRPADDYRLPRRRLPRTIAHGFFGRPFGRQRQS